MIAIRPVTDDFGKRFGSIIKNARQPRAILAAAGREAGNLLKKHFRQKDRTTANTLAPDRRSHLWNKFAQSVQAPVVGDHDVSISITHPIIAQKVFGGPIVAKRVKNLAIPKSPGAYGRSPAVFERETGLKLFVLKSDNGKSLLLAAAKGQSIEVEYLLTPRVNQKADPTALPERQQFAASILQRAAAVLQRQLQGNN